MDPFGKHLRDAAEHSMGIVYFAERSLLIAGGPKRGEGLSRSQVELVYEFVLLRVFLGWEVFLESTFFHFLAGYTAPGGQAVNVPLLVYKDPQVAETTIKGARKYVTWSDPDTMEDLCASHLPAGSFEITMKSARNRLEAFKAIRDRVAHTSGYAKRRFMDATLALAGAQAVEDSPGKFLRGYAPTVGGRAAQRWIDVIVDELCSFAGQIAP